MLARIRRAQVTWLNVKLMLDFVAISRSWIDEDPISGLLVAGVLSANVEIVDQNPGKLRRFLEPGEIPDADRRPVNAMSVALSLGIPRETARIKLTALVERGILTKVDNGVILSSQVVLSEPFMAAIAVFLRAIAEFIDGLSALEACGVLAGDKMASPSWTVGGLAARLFTTHVLRGLDHAQQVNPGISLTLHYLSLALVHLTGSTLRSLPNMPDDGGRLSVFNPRIGPVSVAELSRFTRLDDETVRRQVRRLEGLGAVVRCADGFDINLHGTVFVRQWLDFQHQIEISTRQLVWKLYLGDVLVRSPTHGLSLRAQFHAQASARKGPRPER